MSQDGPRALSAPPARPLLVVRVAFEPGHQARPCLVAAYARVVPIARRPLPATSDQRACPQPTLVRHHQGAQP